MIDIHHHLIFGVDDGARNIETSIQMVEMAAADGITHIACTPHAIAQFPYQFERNAERRAEIAERTHHKVVLGQGCDFHLTQENIDDALQNPTKYTVNGRNYLLVEFDEQYIPPTMTESFYELIVAGARPVLTHPERNPVLQHYPERMEPWIELGCLVQVTANSLTGRFGRVAQKMAYHLLDQGHVQILATDAHNADSRPPILSHARRLVQERYGEALAEQLCQSNPQAVFEGLPLPEPQMAQRARKAKPSLLGRLFGRSA